MSTVCIPYRIAVLAKLERLGTFDVEVRQPKEL